jgi:putative membrane protein
MEMFAWETLGKKTFKGAMPNEMFKPTKVLAANQGLYNGFLAAGLVWSLLISDVAWSNNVALFFLSCVAIAGLYGGATASKKIIYVQALPAIIAIILSLI